MSLINNMLKDLEKRNALQDKHKTLALSYAKINKFAFLKQKKIIFYLMLFLIIPSTLFLLLTHHRATPILTSMLKNEYVNDNPAIQSTHQNTSKPIIVTGISIQIKDNITEVSFFLDQFSLYRLLTNDIENKISLIIDHAELQSELPPLRYMNSAIQNIKSYSSNGDTRFDLFLYPGATIKYVNLNNEDKNPELVVAIEYQKNEKETKYNQPIKAQAMQSMLSQQYQSALNAIKNGQYQEAITQLSFLLKIDQKYQDARVSLAALLIDQGYMTQAKRIVNAGLDINPDAIPLVELKARLLTHEGKIKEALQLLQSSSPSIIDNPDYYAFIAALYERSNHYDLAIKTYRELLQNNQDNSSFWFGLGVSLEKNGQIKEANSAYTKALSTGNLDTESITFLQKRLQVLQGVLHDKE